MSGRYFQSRHGAVFGPLNAVEATLEADPDYTEVQVAPLDAIVIRREDPAYSAVAEHLRAHPPADPQVQALADDLASAAVAPESWSFTVATELIARGRTKGGAA